MNKLLSALALAAFASVASTTIVPVTGASAASGTEKCRHVIGNWTNHLCGDKVRRQLTIRPLPPRPIPPAGAAPRAVELGEGGGGGRN